MICRIRSLSRTDESDRLNKAADRQLEVNYEALLRVLKD
jgi:hypothetical protein